MVKQRYGIRSLMLLILLLFITPCQGKDTLVISKVTTNPKKHYEYLKPIVDYVAAQMSDLGVKQGKVLLARDNDHMVRLLKHGQVDWITETLFSAIEFEQRAGAEMLVRKWKKGVPEYHSIFFTRKDSDIDSLSQLIGKKIAFEDDGSTSAYYIPAAVMLQHELPLYFLDRANEHPPESCVGYLFSGAEINTSTWVHKGIVDVGAYNNQDWNKDDHLPVKFREDFKIIHETPSIPRAIELVNWQLDGAIKERLKQILLHLHEDPNAQKVLMAYQKTSRFDELTPEILQSVEEARAIRNLIVTELE